MTDNQEMTEERADGHGLLIVTRTMMDNRRSRLRPAHGEETLAFYQRSVSEARTELEERRVTVYYVERLKANGTASGHEVELYETAEGECAANCDCIWFTDHRGETPDTVCQHILMAILMERRRLTRGIALPAAMTIKPVAAAEEAAVTGAKRTRQRKPDRAEQIARELAA
jgi:hypothetical protein